MPELGVFAYCTAVGFVAAGTIASFYQLVTSEQADFFATRSTAAGWVVAVAVIMFGGPAIVARKIWTGLRSRQMSALVAAAGIGFTTMWSVCAGIFLLSLLASA